MPNYIEEDGGEVDGKEVAKKSSSKDNKNQDWWEFTIEYFGDICAFHKILCQFLWAQVF